MLPWAARQASVRRADAGEGLLAVAHGLQHGLRVQMVLAAR